MVYNRQPERKLRAWSLKFVAAGLILWSCPVAHAQAQPETPNSFAFAVDVSGSMVGFYNPRTPRPNMVQELLENLVVEFVRPGDRVVFVPFDHEVYSKPGQFLAMSSVDIRSCLDQLEALSLAPRSGRGTVRSAAIGFSVEALRKLEAQPTSDSGAILFVITDLDNDVEPERAEDRPYYELAANLVSSGAIELLSTVAQGSMRLEVWTVKSQPAGAVPDTEDTIQKVKSMLAQVVPLQQTGVAPIASDLEVGELLVKLEQPWEETPSGFKTTATLASTYRVLHVRGQLSLTGRLREQGTPEDAWFEVPVSLLGGDSHSLAPGEQTEIIVEISGVPFPNLTSLKGRSYEMELYGSWNGEGTSDPVVLDQSDPAASAAIANTIYLENWEAPVAVTATQSLPTLPAPRLLQLGFLVGAIAVGVGAWRLFGPKPVPPLTFHYRTIGGGPQKCTLPDANSTQTLHSLGVVLTRPTAEQRVFASANQGNAILNSNREPTDTIEFTESAIFHVVHEHGDVTTINANITGEPLPEPPLDPQDLIQVDENLSQDDPYNF